MIYVRLKKGRFTSEGHGKTRLNLEVCLAALPVIILLVCVACASSQPPDKVERSNIIPYGVSEQFPYDSGGKTLLLRYYPPPNDLPKVQVVSEGSDRSAADGIILSTDWDFTSATPPQADGVSLPFMWPEATSIDSSHSVIRFYTDVEPSLVFVEGYILFRPDSIGEPPSTYGGFGALEEPLAEYECSRFQEHSCMWITQDGFVEVHDIPAEVFDLPHILVFAKWSIDPDDDPDGSAMVNWLFHVKNAGELTQ